MLANKRTDHRSLRRTAGRRPSLQSLDDVLMQKRFDQLKHPTIADPLTRYARINRPHGMLSK